jgi:hypothetical protein
MKKIGILIFILAIMIGVVLGNFFSFGKVQTSNLFDFNFSRGVKGSGNIATETRQVSDFTAIDVGGIFNVEATAGREYAVSVEADDNLLPLIKTEVRRGVLHISTEERIKSSSKITVRVSAPNFEAIDTSGVARVEVSGVSNNSLKLESSGASKVLVSGETTALEAKTSGASKVDAESLRSVDAAVKASGASKVRVVVSGRLTASASGAGKVLYGGSPTNVEKRTSGAGKVDQL